MEITLNRRSPAEQIAGLGIIAIVCIMLAAIDRATFIQFAAHSLMALSFWTVWRLQSIKKLLLEFSLLFSYFVLEIVWSFSPYPALSLIAVLLWMTAALLLTALFWKKDKLAGVLAALPLLWIFYLVSATTMVCINL